MNSPGTAQSCTPWRSSVPPATTVAGFGAPSSGSERPAGARSPPSTRTASTMSTSSPTGAPRLSPHRSTRRILHFEADTADPSRSNVLHDGGPVPTGAFLAGHDIVVNCVPQHTDRPLMFVTDNDLAAFAPGGLIIDVSCDEGRGFSWARPTSFMAPMLTVGDNIRYYAVDHSPWYLWDSATWEISEALLPYLRPCS